jgi:hypothetical protein
MKRLVFLIVSGLVLSACSFGQAQNVGDSLKATPTPTEEKDIPKIITVVLSPENNSGQEGVVTIQEIDGKVKVIIAAKKISALPQPAHIHTGKCPTPGAVKYPLKNVVDGKSETTLDLDMKTLLANGDLAVNIHKSIKEAEVFTACGDIK